MSFFWGETSVFGGEKSERAKFFVNFALGDPSHRVRLFSPKTDAPRDLSDPVTARKSVATLPEESPVTMHAKYTL